MKTNDHDTLRWRWAPLTDALWQDFETLFGSRGACGGCWCMSWRITRKEFEQQKGEGNRRAMKALIDDGEIPGLLAYDGDTPIGWISVAPRTHFPRLLNSSLIKGLDGQGVWSIVCFFVSKNYRRRGVSVKLIQAAVEYAARHGGRILEGYPVDPAKGPYADAFVWTGLASAFRAAGFDECSRPSPTRPVFRYKLDHHTGK